MNFSLRVRIIFAVTSGIACALIFLLPKIGGEAAFQLRFYGLPGLFFAAGVLFPYVSPGRLRCARYVGLVLASVVSYWCAFQTTIMLVPGSASGLHYDDPTWLSFTAGSITGASIVMLALVLIAPIRASFAFVLLGVLAAISGGLVLKYLGFFALGYLRTATGYAVWHTLVCLAIYFGTPSTNPGARFSAGLVSSLRRQT